MRFVVILAVGIVLGTPLQADAQQWTPEQQEVIDSLEGCWDTWMEAVQEGSPDRWLDNCTEEGYTFWWTYGSPLGEDWMRRNWDMFMEDDGEWVDVRPVWVRVYDDFAIMHFWGYWNVTEDEERVTVEAKRTEVFHKVNGRWLLAAGHATPVSQ